ncbi:DUF222 domain-containing protein [Janibacter indicus]|uniref:DUF222 domain-containing protein n=1 Tax=Janibacter indicus TaxID=857417 RepID=A0A7L9IZC5_9MICO|nr:HNH endonuclease signature motif containing protein [Janibacter indicus]QOK22751.1 DUF222 domain-containing protein [Janibacter indicus]
MSVATQWEGLGLVSGLRDSVRAMTMASLEAPRLWQAPDEELAEGLAAIGRARAVLEAAEVALVREGISRGVPGQESWSEADWVGVSEGRSAPRPSVRDVAAVVRVARAGLRAQSELVEHAPTDEGGDPQSQVEDPQVTGDEQPWANQSSPAGLAEVVACLELGELSVGKADQLVRFHEGVRRVADPELLEADLGVLLGAARDEVVRTGPGGRISSRLPGLDERKLAAAITQTTRMLRPAKDLAADDERARSARSLTSHTDASGLTRYKLVLDAEGAAIIDAAVAGLSKPVKGPDGEMDPRPPARRRADALVSIVGRGVSSPGEVGTSDKAQVMVTIAMASLLTATDGSCGVCGASGVGGLTAAGQLGAGGVAGGGHAGGVTASGAVISPASVRRLACEAGVIPVMLGSDSEPLELGRATRFFTPGQKRLLWLRDGGCTFPGCTMPAHWTDAHHVQYWSLGGRTDIGNAALLCERHHTRVHAQELSCTVRDDGVTWHL